MTPYNVHTHIFTMNNAPEHFLNLYLPDFLANAIGKITNTQPGAWLVKKILSFTGEAGKRYAGFLEIGKSRNQLEVFENLLRQYPNQDMKFVALTMYMEKCGAGESISGFEGQLEEILEVKRRYPDRLLIFMGVDPRWKNSGKELRDTVAAYFNKKIKINNQREVYPFAGLKMYPSTGFYPFDKNLKETFEWAAENGVPVLSHCYYKGGIYNNDESYLKYSINPRDPYNGQLYDKPVYIQEKSWKWIIGQKAAQNNRKTCSYFLEPEAYRSLMSYFDQQDKPLKLCLAHFGGAEEMLRSYKLMKVDKGSHYDSKLEPYGIERKNWFEQIREMMKTFKGLYTDISYTVCNQDVHPVIFGELKDAQVGSKILYGTDYYMTEQEKTEKQIFEEFNKAAVKEAGLKPGINAWEQLSTVNTAHFLSSKYYP
ncbi:amidohydrolase family protein [Pedobacter glucosidilyticus]|uniref:amidohydrolase family protein n=1 Tax=Pedobacter glucosidilyticus TaxID=1122941 RepID=UPI0004149A8A|nr:amidohydrolase family protein [Pedobacter glucosidilyticus]